jgi:hypothetical protein
LLLLAVVHVQSSKLGVQVGGEPVAGLQRVQQLGRGRRPQRVVCDLLRWGREGRRGGKKGPSGWASAWCAARSCSTGLAKCGPQPRCRPHHPPCPQPTSRRRKLLRCSRRSVSPCRAMPCGQS